MSRFDDISLKEAELENIITNFENKIHEISGKFDEIKAKTSILDGDPAIWRSKSQEQFKLKKDNYIEQFDVVIRELTKELELLKEARFKLTQTEQNIAKNVDYLINDIV